MGNIEYKDAMYLCKTSSIISNWIPQPGIPTLPSIVESTLVFTNTTYPSLLIDLPDPISGFAGTLVRLPDMQGQYEDDENYYKPLKWSAGEFGQNIKLKRSNINANLIFEVTPKDPPEPPVPPTPAIHSYVVIDVESGEPYDMDDIMSYTVQTQITGSLAMPDTPFILI